MYYVYILYSESSSIYYKGYSTDPERRLDAHNQDLSRYTRGKGPWRLVYLKAFETKRQALIEEKRLKRLNTAAIERLINE